MYLLGLDEVGTGSFVGPAVICGIRSKIDWNMFGLNDSKKLTPNKREELKQQLILNKEIEFCIVEKSNIEIDQFGLGVVVKEAYLDVIKKLYQNEDRIIIDGQDNSKYSNEFRKYDVEFLVKADQKIPQVMAASIIAKTYRDNLLKELGEKYPKYGWDKNSGYITKSHIEAIKKFGLTELHRKSYKVKI